MNILDQLAGNKMISNLVMGKIRKYIKDENISLIALYVNEKNDIEAKQYDKPVVIVNKEDYEFLIEYYNATNNNLEKP